MKKTTLLLCTGFAGLLFFSGACARNIDFTPQGRYDRTTNNRNNQIVLNLRAVEAENKANVKLPVNINNTFFQKTLENKFEESKRFSIISASRKDKYKDAMFILDVFPKVEYAQKNTARQIAFGYTVKMAFDGVNAEGVKEFALNTAAGAGDKTTNTFTGDGIDVEMGDRLLSRAIEKCFNQVYPELCKRYPITGNVLSARSSGKDTFLQIDRGSENGIRPNEAFIVVALDEKDNEIFIALARAIPARTTSRLEILHWNEKDADVAVVYRPKLRKGDEALLEKLFVVSQSARTEDVAD